MKEFMKQAARAAPLYGLVLAGGVSSRMGRDKGRISWHGKEQRYYLAGLMRGLTENVFIGCRPDQAQAIAPEYPAISDAFSGAGPLGSIVSAFQAFPVAGWLVVACDLPLMDLPTLQFLVQHRNPAVLATAFRNPGDGLPEPLTAIWEPRAFQALSAELDAGTASPRRILANHPVQLLEAPNPNALMNVNTPAEAESIDAFIKGEGKSRT